MSKPSFAAMTLVAALIAGPFLAPAIAQTDAPAVSTPAPAAPAPSGQTSISSLSGTLGIASVKLENGWRASKLIGASVYNEQNEKIGSIDDLIVKNDDKIMVAVISVGGFLGIGSKLIAVSFNEIHMDSDKAMLIGASKEALNSQPSFTYGG